MSLIADRPWPIKFEYMGNWFQIAFRYVETSEVPTHAVIFPRENVGELYIYDIVEGPWASYEDAVETAKLAAEHWINQQSD